MSQVVSFTDYTPAARYDGIAWTTVIVEEAETAVGPWTTIDTITLDPVDADPTTPQARSLTTDSASDTLDLWYRLTFADINDDTGQPTTPVQNSANNASLYVTRDELKSILKIQNEDFADAAIDIAVRAATDAINGYKRTRYYTIEETRYYSPDSSLRRLPIYPLATITSLLVDADGDGDYETTWVEGTDFLLGPANAAVDGLPYTQIELPLRSLRSFPCYERALKVTGAFGWGTTPTLVRQAATLIANRFLTRTRSAPLGILVQAANDVVAMARLGSIDPDVAFSLEQVPDMRIRATSVQLG